MKQALAGAESSVVSTTWTKHFSDRWFLDPQHMRRQGTEPGKDLARRPRKLGFYEEHGYDASGRLRVSRRHARQFQETQVVSYGDGFAVAIMYSSDITHGVVFAGRYAQADDGRVLFAEQLWPHGLYALERYTYDDAGRVVQVEFERAEDPSGPRAQMPRRRGKQRISYDGSAVARVSETDSRGNTQVLLAVDTVDASSLTQPVLDAVVKGIWDAVIAHRPEEEMSLLGLRYHPGGAILPGADVCPRSRADELARTSDRTLMFNPAEWRVPDLAFRLPKPDAARCEDLDRWAQQNQQVDLPRELALAAAARLRTMPWSDARPVTETFFVFAVDFDLQHLEQDVLPHAPSHLTN